MSSKILVTGGAGYIGTTLVPMLLGEGHKVRVLDSLMYGGHGLLPVISHQGFEFVKGDVRNTADLNEAVKGCDAVVHLAAIVGFPACRKHPELAQSVNFEGTRTVAEAAGPGRLILFASTGSNYGALTEKVCTEETPLNPLSLYGKTKTAAERYLLDRGDVIAYRFATAFGLSPRMRLDLLVNDFVHTALNQRYLVVYEKDFMRSFIHVSDMARAFLFALENQDRMRGEVYNVGSEDMNSSKADVCELIRRKLDFYLHYAEVGADADKRNYVVSYKKIKALGYRTTIGLEQGVDDLIRGLQLIDIRNPFSNV